MRKQCWVTAGECEATLAQQLQPIASELRSFDVVDLIAFSRLERSASLKSLVNSAVEQFFKPGNIEMLDAGDAHVAWGRAPEIELSFSFISVPMQLYFRMLLSDSYSAVGIDYIDCPASWKSDPEFLGLKFRETLHQARLETA